MGDEITTEDGGKRVIDSNGTEIGVVLDVEDGTAYVDPNDEIGGELKTRLGWGPDTGSRYPLRNDAIGEITDEEIRLRGEY
ncbi:PRC-barrel domain containing protein [Natrinema versiforme]|uniref:PRC-barrel domain containing protein n=1 Tax=Natrinema versiforme TaxID=88724 RepID=A0A4V1FXD7_9EURY|nr:PRC-barrel domain containing protein [Natrinema versiforme]QCS40938.1 PRC-barrel domain containing protein [Natrinema versiforme]